MERLHQISIDEYLYILELTERAANYDPCKGCDHHCDWGMCYQA